MIYRDENHKTKKNHLTIRHLLKYRPKPNKSFERLGLSNLYVNNSRLKSNIDMKKLSVDELCNHQTFDHNESLDHGLYNSLEHNRRYSFISRNNEHTNASNPINFETPLGNGMVP